MDENEFYQNLIKERATNPVALRNIIIEGDPILYEKSRPVETFDENLSILIDDMIETMRSAKGVGLAAPQIGILKRVVVIDVGDGLMELVNPEIVDSSGEQKAEEGCLSCPGAYGVTLRPMYATVKAKDRFGNEKEYKGHGLKTRAFCHEIDHLDGILFKSRLISK